MAFPDGRNETIINPVWGVSIAALALADGVTHTAGNRLSWRRARSRRRPQLRSQPPQSPTPTPSTRCSLSARCSESGPWRSKARHTAAWGGERGRASRDSGSRADDIKKEQYAGMARHEEPMIWVRRVLGESDMPLHMGDASRRGCHLSRRGILWISHFTSSL